MNDIIRDGITEGISFPDIYDWTVGEILDYIRLRRKSRKEELREKALMDFKLASLTAKFVGKVFGGNGKQTGVMDEYTWLWSDKDKKEIAMERLKEQLMANSVVKEVK